MAWNIYWYINKFKEYKFLVWVVLLRVKYHSVCDTDSKFIYSSSLYTKFSSKACITEAENSPSKHFPQYPIHPHTLYMQTQIKGHYAHSTLKAHYSHRIGSQKHNYDPQPLIHLKTKVPLIFQTFNQVTILVNEL